MIHFYYVFCTFYNMQNNFFFFSQRLYKERGINDQHSYTITTERPEITQAKINASNFSEVRQFKLLTEIKLLSKIVLFIFCALHLLQVKYRESWHTLRAQGYKLTMQDIPFQAAKNSTGFASDVSRTGGLTLLQIKLGLHIDEKILTRLIVL